MIIMMHVDNTDDIKNMDADDMIEVDWRVNLENR